MTNLGRVTAGLLVAAVVGAAVVSVLSMPDIRRYLSIRKM